PASSEREKISFNQINKKTGNRIRYRKIDAETGDEVDSAEIIKGYEVGKGQYIEVEPEELEAIAIESKRTIEIDAFVPKKEIDEFVPKKEIDELYLNSPYYLALMAKSVNRRLRSFAKQSARKGWWRSGFCCEQRPNGQSKDHQSFRKFRGNFEGDTSGFYRWSEQNFGKKPTQIMTYMSLTAASSRKSYNSLSHLRRETGSIDDTGARTSGHIYRDWTAPVDNVAQKAQAEARRGDVDGAGGANTGLAAELTSDVAIGSPLAHRESPSLFRRTGWHSDSPATARRSRSRA